MEEILEEQIKPNLSVSDMDIAKNGKDVEKSNHNAALTFLLNNLTSELLETIEHEQKLVQIDEQKLKESKLHAPVPTGDDNSSKKGKQSNSKDNGKTSAKTKTAKKNTMFDQVMNGNDPLQELIIGGINNQIQTNKIISSLSEGGEEISEIAGEAAKEGSDWIEKFYTNGKSTGAPGTTGSSDKGIAGAIASNDTAEIQHLTAIWTYIQQQVSQVNNQYQTVAGLPSTMMQSLTQAVNTSMSGNTSTIQAMGTAVGLISGWAGV